MKLQKRRGFTLVELLIVIVVIGILASGMMLAAGGATDSAKAATAISDLRSAKAAALIWIADNAGLNTSEINTAWNDGGGALTAIQGLMDNIEKSKGLVLNTNHGTTGVYFIGLTSISKDHTVLAKVGTQSKGVIAFKNTFDPVSTDVTAPYPGNTDAIIWMRVR